MTVIAINVSSKVTPRRDDESDRGRLLNLSSGGWTCVSMVGATSFCVGLLMALEIMENSICHAVYVWLWSSLLLPQ